MMASFVHENPTPLRLVDSPGHLVILPLVMKPSHKGQMKGEAPDADLYSRQYFLSHCGGHETYRESFGEKLDSRLSVLWAMSCTRPGMRVLDIGCGRGELARRAGCAGALCWALDLSEEALEITRETLSHAPQRARRMVVPVRGDASSLPFEGRSFDRVMLSDILEHLPYETMKMMLREVHRVLRPDGMAVFHTFPNRWFYDFHYPVLRAFLKWAKGLAPPRDPRSHYERLLHVNELSPLDLRRAFGECFSVRIWCAHRRRWRPQGGTFGRRWSILGLFTEPEIWGQASPKEIHKIPEGP
jgi:ubiquinone/menaquinone biosynthesis C-methylase UbiE